jgi:hypothetical protein
VVIAISFFSSKRNSGHSIQQRPDALDPVFLPDHREAAKFLLHFSMPPMAHGTFPFRDVHAIAELVDAA